MKPLIVLLSVFAASVLISRLVTGTLAIIFPGNVAMCAMLFLTGLGHFLYTKGMAMMLLSRVPYKTALVFSPG